MVIILMDCLIKIVSKRNLEEAKEDIQTIVNELQLGIVEARLGCKMLWWAVGRLGRLVFLFKYFDASPQFFFTYERAHDSKAKCEPLKNWIWSRAVLRHGGIFNQSPFTMIQTVLDPEKEVLLQMFHLRNHKSLRTKSLSSFKSCVCEKTNQI